MENQRQHNSTAAEQVRRALRLRSYASIGVRASSDPIKPVHVELKISKAMTARDAEVLIGYLKAHGLCSDYDFLKDGEEYKED